MIEIFRMFNWKQIRLLELNENNAALANRVKLKQKKSGPSCPFAENVKKIASYNSIFLAFSPIFFLSKL
jgi:hypothetical protein